jgi:hypothetical protein
MIWLVLLKEIINICSENHKETINIHFWQNAESMNAKTLVHHLYCYIYEVSLDTRQQWTALDSIVTQQCNQAVIEFYSNDTVDYRLLFQSGVRLGCEWTARQLGLEIGRVQLYRKL